MMKHIAFFRNEAGNDFLLKLIPDKVTKRITYEDCEKLYRVVKVRKYEKDQKLAERGRTLDRLFIILQGSISACQPQEKVMMFNTYWDIYKYVLKHHDQILGYNDGDSLLI